METGRWRDGARPVDAVAHVARKFPERGSISISSRSKDRPVKMGSVF